MSYRDDDYEEEEYDDEDEEYYDDDDDDDEEVGSRKPVNPFTSGGYKPGGTSNLPGRDRFGTSGSSRPGGTNPSGGGFGSRLGGPPPASGGGGITRDDINSRLGSSSSPFRSSSAPAGDLRSGLLGGDKDKDKKDDDKSAFGSRPGPFTSGGSGSGQRFGSPGGDKKDTDKPGSRPGSFTSGGSGGAPRFGSPGGDKKDDPKRSTSEVRPAGSSGSSFGSRFGPPGGDKKDDPKRSASEVRPAGSSGSSFGSRPGFGSGDKKDDKKDDPKSGGLGGFTQRLGFGGKKEDDKPAAQSKAPAGGIGSRLPFGGKKEDERPGGGRPTSGGNAPSGGGLGSKLGGLTSRLPFGGKKEESSPTSAPRPGGSSFGSSASSSSLGGQSAFGKSKSGPTSGFAPSTPKGGTQSRSTTAQGGLLSRVTSAIPFLGGRGDAKSTARKSRPSKVPSVQQEGGLTLDNKLDILGVVLLFGSLALFVSALSPTQGSLTAPIINAFGRLLGWGALGVPIAMFAIGLWLVVRHFGEQAPIVDLVRIWGVVMGYLGLLVLFQFVDAFNYRVPIQDLPIQLELSAEVFHAGGGHVGGYLYYLLVSNVTEIGGFLMLVGWMVISVMFLTRTSASELAVSIISIWRGFNTAVERRAVRRRALVAQRQAAQQIGALGAPQISVSRAAPAELPSASTAALPPPSAMPDSMPVPSEERKIAISMGGRTVTTSFGPTEQGKPETGASPMGLPVAPPPAATAASAPTEGGRTGFGSRLLGSMPFGRKEGEATGTQESPKAVPKPDTSPESGGIGSRLGGFASRLPIGGKKEAEKEQTGQPAASKPEAPAATGGGIGSRLGGLTSRLPMGGKTETPATAKADDSGDDLRGTFGKPAAQSAKPVSASAPAPTAGTPFKPAVPAPPGAKDSESVDEEERPTRFADLLRPSSPAASGAPPPPKTGSSPFSSPFRKPDSALSSEKSAEEKTEKPASSFASLRSPTLSSRLSVDKAPEDAMDDLEDEEDEVMDRLSPATPKGIGPAPRKSEESPFKVSIMGAKSLNDEDEDEFDDDDFDETLDNEPLNDLKDEFDDEDDLDDEDEEETGADGNLGLADRMNRLNEIRSGTVARPGMSPADKQTVSAYPSDSRGKTEGPKLPEKPTAPAAAAPPALGVRPFAAGDKDDKPATPVGTSPFNRPAPPPINRTPEQPTVSTPTAAKPPSPAYSSTPPPPPGVTAPTPSSPTFNPPSSRPPAAPTMRTPKRDWKIPDYKAVLAVGSEQDFDREFLVQRARIIEETLLSFGAPGRVVEINTGPVITQFGVEPDYLTGRGGKKNRVKVSAIAQLDKDIQLALGAKSIRIEAPVPGKGFVGIEVPNEAASLVSLRDVMDADEFQRIHSPLAIALGQSVDGTPVAADLTGMPHLLIAGTTGSGKSVCVNSIISSILTRNTPDKVKLVMVDPKRVELTGYNGVPHLIAPVVVELERIVGVLKWVTREMDERYKRFSNAGARNIEDFNKHLPMNEEWMPYLVVIIDELADLMMLAPDETERVITRIAALARATGIHLVIATQRPSVDVVTGLIKANFPARIAFAVAGSVDSRVILDQPGAERLLGRGDMLYMSGDSPAPLRLQGVFVSDVEINNIVRYWKGQDDGSESRPIPAMVLDRTVASESPSRISTTPTPMPARTSTPAPTPQRAFWDDRKNDLDGDDDDIVDENNDGEDDMYEEAVELVRRLNKASVSLLQRRLRIGYTRAARLIDIMEERGVVGPAESGSKPREVLPVKD
jgi:S-DNA-T family DNA segregation ATPase FtsK/SpoIIIE